MPLIDFAILTGLREEFDTLRKIFPELKEISEGAELWYRTRVIADGKSSYEVVISFQDKMGPLDAQALTAKALGRWHPALIILVGIAGTFHKEVRLGDVLVSQQVFYYDLAKATAEGLRYRPQGYPCSTVLIRQTEALRSSPREFGAWQQAAKSIAASEAERLSAQGLAKLPGKRLAEMQRLLRDCQPEIHFGTVASGSLVIADKAKQKELLALHGQIIGTEMEGAGMLHATFDQELPTPAVVIKGISDAADMGKALLDSQGSWRTLAKENSARLVLQVIRRGRIRPLETDQFELDPSPGSPADARIVIPDPTASGVSFLHFPRLLVPRGPLTEIGFAAEAFAGVEPIGIAKLVVQYVDYDGAAKQARTLRTEWRPLE
ncbi:MAG TPA: hypothetical protein VHQ90_03365 [Thermoanaerobaculia bacterium]|nr:hypothetical protein [Thermoanaerobaculia bacterium]